MFDPGFNTEFSTLAFGGVRFHNLAGYSDDYGVRVKFFTPPTDYDTVFLAVSDWATNSWRWFSIPEDSYIPMPGLLNYINEEGQMYVLACLMANETVELEWVIIGDRLDVDAYLYANLDVDPTQNFAPRLVTFYATSSQVYGGEIVSYDFDWQDDGDFDVTGDEDGVVQHTYSNPGIYTARVRVFDDEGNFSDATLSFTIIDPDNEAPVAQIEADVTAGTAPQAVNVDASGSTDDKGIIRYEWDLDGDGDFERDTADSPVAATVVGMAGTADLSVRITDVDLATDVASVGVTLPNGFGRAIVAENVNSFSPVSAAVCGEAPDEYIAAAIQAQEDSDLIVARSQDTSGSSWLGPYLAAPAEDNTGSYPSVVKAQFGNAVVVFGSYEAGTHSLQAVFATDENCTSWFDPVTIDTFTGSQYYWDAAIVDGTINVIAAGGTVEDGSNSVYHYRSTNESGTNWTAGSLVYDEPSSAWLGGISIGTRLVGAEEWPVIGFTRGYYGETPAGLAMVTSANHDGTAWGAPTWYTDYNVIFCNMDLVNMRPAVVTSTISGDSAMRYVRASSPDGSNWPAAMDVVEAAVAPAYADIAIVGDIPVICYQDHVTQNLMYMTAKNADGSEWNQPFVAASAGKCGRLCTLVVVDGVTPVILYKNDTDNNIECAYWQ